MSAQALQSLCDRFALGQGKISLLVEAKSDPSLCAAVNADARLPSASVIKIAVACTAADLAARGDIDLTQSISRGSLDETFYCSILHAFDADDPLTLKALIGLMLIVSDNPATSAVLQTVGMDRVNNWLDQNGLQDTNLSLGFEDAHLGTPLRVNLTTARDCLTLLKRVDSDPTYAFIKRMLANNLRNERIPKQLPDDTVIAHKTGTLAGLVHDIAIIESPIAAYYLVVLADELEDDAEFVCALNAFSADLYEMMTA
ncbi:MAG: class A beta-lactamase-related serine hydrolase [Hyphomonadaceae bacterium]|nr:class A beta-lactamase-related serine hydrolase [Hyphomonadaceae bacterium]